MFNIFGQKKIVIYLKRSSLEIYTYDQEGPVSQLEFPQDVTKYEEIVDKSKFENLLSSFFTKQIEKRAGIIILLSEEITFQKTLDASLTPQAEFQKFVAKIPFDPQKLIAKQIAVQNQTYFVGTNKTIFEAIVNALKINNNNVRAVVPVIVFGITGQSINSTDIAKVFSSGNILKAANLLGEKAGQNMPAKTRIENIRKKSVTQAILGVFAIVLFAIAAALIYLRFSKSAKRPVINYQQPVQIQNEATGEASPSAIEDFESTTEATSSP